MKKWIETAVSICKIANGADLEAKKLLCGEIFGLNLFLENRKVGINADQFLSSPQKNKWVLLRKTALKLTKNGAPRRNSDFCRILEPRLGFEPRTPSLPWKCSTTELSRHGAGSRIRTYEGESQQIYSLSCLTASLSQQIWSRFSGSNRGPTVYKTVALTN